MRKRRKRKVEKVWSVSGKTSKKQFPFRTYSLLLKILTPSFIHMNRQRNKFLFLLLYPLVFMAKSCRTRSSSFFLCNFSYEIRTKKQSQWSKSPIFIICNFSYEIWTQKQSQWCKFPNETMDCFNTPDIQNSSSMMSIFPLTDT